MQLIINAWQHRDPGLPTWKPAPRLPPAQLVYLKHKDLEMIVLFSQNISFIGRIVLHTPYKYYFFPLGKNSFSKQSHSYLSYGKDDKLIASGQSWL